MIRALLPILLDMSNCLLLDYRYRGVYILWRKSKAKYIRVMQYNEKCSWDVHVLGIQDLKWSGRTLLKQITCLHRITDV